MIILCLYFFISLNFVFPSEQENIPKHRMYKELGEKAKIAFSKFYDYYYSNGLFEEIEKNYKTLDFKRILKENNKSELTTCLAYSDGLTLENKFVKTNLVEFIRYSPLYFQSVVNDIKEKQKPQIPKEKMKKLNSSEKINASKVQQEDVFFEKYLSDGWLPFIIGSGLFLPGLFSKKELKVKIPLSLLLAFSGGGGFWMWQQQKIKKLKNLKKLEEEKEEAPRENGIKQNDVPPISQNEVDEYYKEILINETKESKDYSFANDVIKKLVIGSQDIYNQIGEKVKKEEENRAKELLLQEEEKKKREEADLANTINTNLNSKNREALNKELEKITAICSGFETKYDRAVDFIEINEPNNEKRSLIKSIFQLIYVSLKQYYFDFEGDENSKTKIPKSTYKIFFDGHGCLNILGKSEQTTYSVLLNKTIGSRQDIVKENNVISHNGFYRNGFIQRGGKEEDAQKYFYHLPSIFKDEKTLDTDSINKLFDLILLYKYENIKYNEKF